MSGSKPSDLQLYFTGVYEDFVHIFLTCSKTFIKILKVGKIFWCVTSFHQYFFVTIKLIAVTSITNIKNSSTIISMRAMWQHFYIGLACQNCFAHSVLVLMALSMALSNFVKGLMRSNTIHKATKFLLILYFLKRYLHTYNCPSKQTLISIFKDSVIIILYILYIQY